MTKIGIEASEYARGTLGDEFEVVHETGDKVVLDETFADVVEFVVENEITTGTWLVGEELIQDKWL